MQDQWPVQYFSSLPNAYSKWVKLKVTNTTTTLAMIAILDKLFKIYGVSIIIMSDNGIQLTVIYFNMFLQTSGVKYQN